MTVPIEEIENIVAGSSAVPAASDSIETPYGALGKWMLKGSEIASWIGQKVGGKTLYEPINVIIVDRTATTPEEATARLIAAMTTSTFPARWRHSDGYSGTIDGLTYAQQPPNATNKAFSDANTLLPNNHGRVFGPSPLADGGFVWTAQFSREKVGFVGIKPTHVYVSFQQARDAVRDNFVAASAGELIGDVDLGNAYSSDSITTGDADGRAVVLELAAAIPEPRVDLLAGEPSDEELEHWWATATSPADPLPGVLAQGEKPDPDPAVT